MVKEINIYDKVKGENYIISLGELIKRLEQIDASLMNGQWKIENGAYGYGDFICSIEESLKDGDSYLIDGKKIFSVLKSEEEYFYHVIMKRVDLDFEIGLFDSTYIFVRSNDDKLIEQIRKLFNEVKVIE